MSRLRVGLLYTFNPVWTGGLIYLQNIVNVLGFLPEAERPSIIVYYKPSLKAVVEELQYSDLRLQEIDYPGIFTGTLKSALTQKNCFIDSVWERRDVDVLFPVKDMPMPSAANTVAWFADLQHRHYPDFFSLTTRWGREARLRLMLRNCSQLVVSSQSVVSDLTKFYRIPETLKISVYRFVSPINRLPAQEVEAVLDKRKLKAPFFLISNQFHNHKNHSKALEAFGLAKGSLGDCMLLMTGRLPGKHESSYIQELHRIIDKFDLSDRVKFLGLIPRGEQIALMQSSLSVIQPSLFEGWSTVIEDAKSLQVKVIASDLPVHREQLGESALYFDPKDAEALSRLLIRAARSSEDNLPPRYRPMEQRAKASADQLLRCLSWRRDS